MELSFKGKVMACVVSATLAVGLCPAFAMAAQGDTLATGSSLMLSDQNSGLVAQDALSDGTYSVPNLDSSLGMYHFQLEKTRLVVKGDNAWLCTTTAVAPDKTPERYSAMAFGKQSEILDASDPTNKTLVPGTPIAEAVNDYDADGKVVNARTFILPISKAAAESGEIYYMLRYVDGYSADHDGDWYEAVKGDYKFTLGALTKQSDDTSLLALSKDVEVTNNTKMFLANAAKLNTYSSPNAADFSQELVLTMGSDSLSKFFVGTAKDAEKADPSKICEFDTATKTVALPMTWIEGSGESAKVKSHADGKPFTVAYYSVGKGEWFERAFVLDELTSTLRIYNTSDVDAAAIVDELIAAIQVQSRTAKTDEQCIAAKAAWDDLTNAQRELVEEYDYFGLDTGDASKDNPRNADGIGENEILVVSFGTSFNDNRVETIGGVEKALEDAYPLWSVRRAFTAQIIINHVQSRDGEKIDNMDQALKRAVKNGVKNLVVVPTHLMHGAEYDEMCDALKPYEAQMSIVIAEPLLGEVGASQTDVNKDKETVAKAVVAAACKDAGYADAAAAEADGAAIVLMGHGTAHSANITYEQMQTMMGNLGYKNVFIGTVEGKPESTKCSVIIDKVKDAGYKKVILRPLMVVAGDHANNDMADPDDPESWLSQFTAAKAFDSVKCQISGLGSLPEVQKVYVEHVADVAPSIVKDISGAKVTLTKSSSVYTGKKQKGAVKSVVLDGKTLKEGTDYTVSAKSGKNVGSYPVTITGKGIYAGTAKADFKITKATPKVKTTSKKTYKAATLKKKAASFTAIKLTTDGKATYKVTKNTNKKKISFKAGKVTVKKGTAKGKYTLKVKTSAKAGKNYKALKAKTYTITITVK